MGQCIADENQIREIVFFSTKKLEFFMALTRDGFQNHSLAGRVNYVDGQSWLFTSHQDESSDSVLRAKMLDMVDTIASLYGAEWVHLVFKNGLSSKLFLEKLRGVKQIFGTSRPKADTFKPQSMN